MKCWEKIVVISFLFVLFTSNWCWATIWYLYDNEDGVVGNPIPNTLAGPYHRDTQYPSAAVYSEDSFRSKYVSLFFPGAPQNEFALHCRNPNGTYGIAFSEATPITLVAGRTYYLAGFFKFEKINNNDIWQNYNDFDKLIEMRGNGFRWLIDSGFPDVTSYAAGKLTFTASVAKSVVPWPGYDHLTPNVSPYNGMSNPPFCDYGRWYAVVLGVTAYANSNGRVRLWINGSLTTDYSGQTMGLGATITVVGMNGTIGQPGYDAPAHKRQFDRIILTDNWQDIINGGYMGANPIPAAPTGLRIITPSN